MLNSLYPQLYAGQESPICLYALGAASEEICASCMMMSRRGVVVAMPAVSTHLGRACHIVVFAHVELANGASRAAFEQPFVDALSVEEVQTRHRSQFFSCFVVDEAHHAFHEGFVLRRRV